MYSVVAPAGQVTVLHSFQGGATDGLNPFAGTAFSISTMAIALPATAKVISWLATTWRSRPTYSTPMLFALAAVGARAEAHDGMQPAVSADKRANVNA